MLVDVGSDKGSVSFAPVVVVMLDALLLMLVVLVAISSQRSLLPVCVNVVTIQYR